MGKDILERICADTREDVTRRKTEQSLQEMRGRAEARQTPRGFARALMDAVARGRTGLIAEIKKASPSAGLIRPDFNPADLARDYRAGGAVCLSVLTNRPYFQGETTHLKEARAAVALPVLRKEFILDPWQVYESRAMGADAILLIMAILSDDEAHDLEELAMALDMDVLVEVHDEAELERAMGLQARLVGINNRDLKTMTTSLDISERLAPQVSPERFVIAESGIRTPADIERLKQAGIQAILVGESLMRQPDITHATRALLGIAD
jgi:indole-3-glycerol phosphate synthase